MKEGASFDRSLGESFIRFEFETGVEVVVKGDESRTRLAWRIVDHLAAISGMAVRLLEDFMRNRGVFDLSSIEVFDTTTADGGDFSLSYSFTADHDIHEYGYTYFEVFFGAHEPPSKPFWPHKFTVGFH